MNPVVFVFGTSAVMRIQTFGTSGRSPPLVLITFERSSESAAARFVLIPGPFGMLSTVKLANKSLGLLAYVSRFHAVAAVSAMENKHNFVQFHRGF